MKKKKHNSGSLNSVTAVISTAMVLVLVGTVLFFVTMADSVGRTLRENFTVALLLEDSISDHQVSQLQRQLEAQPYTRQVVYTSKAQATAQQRRELNIDPNEFLGYSPLPATFELFLKADYADADSLRKFVPQLERQSGISEVVYPRDLMEAVNRNIRKVSLVLLSISALLGVVSIALINNTMRLSAVRHKHNIQTMKLVGARWNFIRRPFLRQALWIGLLASFFADATLLGGCYALQQWDTEAAALVTPLNVGITLGVVAAIGIALTQFCALLSVNKLLGMSRSDAYLY